MSSALAAALPRLTDEMHRINRLLAAGHKSDAIEQFYQLASEAIHTQRDDISCKGFVIPGRTTEISVLRIPAEPRPDKPIALFLPGLLSALPLAAVRALAFIDLFDIVLFEIPGHGASGEVSDVSLAAFANEFSAVIGAALPRASGLFVIGESLGGLVALTLARLRPDQIRNVILIDTPFHLTRPELAAWISSAWHTTGRRPYVRRICREIMGFDPDDGRVERTTLHHDLVQNISCLHLTGGVQAFSGIPSVVTESDITLLRAANPKILIPPRIPETGHAVLLDNPNAARAALHSFLLPRPLRALAAKQTRAGGRGGQQYAL